MIRRPPRSTRVRSSAASDVYKRQGRPQAWPHCVRWGLSSPPQKGGGAPRAPIFGHVYCGQTAAWIKIPLGTEVGLGPDDIVLDGDPAPPSPTRGQSPLPQCSAHVYCGQTAGWIKVAHGMEVGRGPGHIMGTQLPSPKRNRAPPNFWPMYIVAKRLDGLRRHLVRK